MNIFYLDTDPRSCAEMHNDKHCVKMILEYAQLLSTAHRVLDGEQKQVLSKTGRKVKRWVLEGSRETTLYQAAHVNHPSAIWTRQSRANYDWLYVLWRELMSEYTYRYGRVHVSEKLVKPLEPVPYNIPHRDDRFPAFFTEPTPAMPDECKIPGDSLKSYRKYYCEKKQHLAKWKQRPVPSWYQPIL